MDDRADGHNIKKNPSVLQDWLLLKCSWRQQTLLFTALRGSDGLPKNNAGKVLCRYLRQCILRDATPNRGTFMGVQEAEAAGASAKFLNAHDEYPYHFIMHLIHSAEVLGYKHPVEQTRVFWKKLYEGSGLSFQMRPETERQMNFRLQDDV